MGSFRDTTRVPASRQLVYSINVDFSSRFLCSKYRCRPACRIAMSIAKKQTSCWLWMPCEMQMFGPLWRWKWWSSVIWQSSQRDLYHTSLDCNDCLFLSMWVPIWNLAEFSIAPCHETWIFAKLLRGTSFTGGVDANHCHRLTERAGEAFLLWRVKVERCFGCASVLGVF